MDPTSGQFPCMTPGQLGYPELTPAQLANPRTEVTVSGFTLELWQVGHIYGVSYDPPVSTGKWKESAVGDHSLSSTSVHEDESSGHQSSSSLQPSRCRQLSTASSGTSGSFYARPTRREGTIGPPTGEGTVTLPQIRSRSREGPEAPTTATQPKYSLFPRVDPPRTAAAPASTPTESYSTKMSGPGPGSGALSSQPELKSVWEHPPSPPDWKKTVKGAVSKGLRQVGSSLALRSKKSNAGLKETPHTDGAEVQKATNNTDKHAPPMPPITWNTTPGSSYGPNAGIARSPVFARRDETGTSISSLSGPIQSPPGLTQPSTSRQMAIRPTGPLCPPPEGRFRHFAERALATGITVQPFDPNENSDGVPPVPLRSARRPPPPETSQQQSMAQNQHYPASSSSQHRAIRSPTTPTFNSSSHGPLTPNPMAATTGPPPAFTSPRPAPPPPLPPHVGGQTEQERGRSKSITNIFRRGRQGEDNRQSEGSQTSKKAK